MSGNKLGGDATICQTPALCASVAENNFGEIAEFLLIFLDRSSIMVSMNRLTREERVRVIAALVEGNSIRATVRMARVAKNTVVKLLCDIGQACQQYHDKVMVNLPCKRLQVDEIWTFCYAKEKNLPEAFKGQFGYGDVWTWTAIDADTKLVPQSVRQSPRGRVFPSVQPQRSDRLSTRCHTRQCRSAPYIYVIRGAAEPHDENVYEETHATDKQVQ
jgi:hypothetical protein